MLGALKKLVGLSATQDLAEAVDSPDQRPAVVRILPDSDETRGRSLLRAREIEQFPFTIGRWAPEAVRDEAEDNAFLIRESEPFRLSRQHCGIHNENGRFFVRDSVSRKGTLVNGHSLGAKSGNHEVELVDGENTLQLGGDDSPFRFKLLIERQSA